MAEKLKQQLKEVGSKLQNPPSTKGALLILLKQAKTCLSKLEQSPSASIVESMHNLAFAVVKPELLKHRDGDVKLLVATCVCEIARITAPLAPYSDDVLKDVFHLIVGTFGGLRDMRDPSFGMRVDILEIFTKYRLFVVILDLECDDLVNEMFSNFFAVASKNHPENVVSSMQIIMIILIEESEEIREDLLLIVLSALGRYKNYVITAARRLAMNVMEQCVGKLEAGIKQFIISSMSGDSKSVKYEIDYHELIYDVYCCAPQIITGVAPHLTRRLLSDQRDTRLKTVGLVGNLFALPGFAISEAFEPLFSEFLKMLTDRDVTVRMSVLDHAKSYLLSNTFKVEAAQIISALCNRMLDCDEKVRKQVIAVICDAACHDLSSIPAETVKLAAERLRDKSLLVKKYTLERLAEIYRVYCLKCDDGSIKSNVFDWIPGKILRCFYDKDFRSDTIEAVVGSLFPSDFSTKDKVQHWVRVFSGFDKVELKALEKIMEQKQGLHQQMQRSSVSQADVLGLQEDTFMLGAKIDYPNLDEMKARKKAAKETKKKEKAESSKNEQMHSLLVSENASLLKDKDVAFNAVSSFILPADEAIPRNMGMEKTCEEWTSHMTAATETEVMLTRFFEEQVKSLKSLATMAIQKKELEEQAKKRVEAEKEITEEALRQALRRVKQLEAELEIKSKEAESSIVLKDAEIAKLKDMVVNQYTDATLRTRYELFKEYKAGKHIGWNIDEEIAEYEELTSDDEENYSTLGRGV